MGVACTYTCRLCLPLALLFLFFITIIQYCNRSITVLIGGIKKEIEVARVRKKEPVSGSLVRVEG